MSLNKMAQECYQIAASKGWHEDQCCETPGDPSKLATEEGYEPSGVNYHVVGTYIALIHSEASEALEALRRDNEPDGKRTMQLYFVPDKDGKPKPEGLAVELVDVLIRVFDDAAALGLDLDSAYQAKMAYNRSRPHRHGGKNM
ncbi:MAG: hypothetical protein AB7W59_00265 [Acidimicrobiia bacterium]